MNANPNNDPPVEYPWKRRRSQRPKTDPVDHYEDESFNYYGYNKKKIQFPLYRNDGMAQKLHDQLTNNLRYQISYRHVFNLEETCSHGNSFLEDDDSLVKVADHVTIYNENREETVAMSIYARKSDGDCHCQVQPDTTMDLLWNLGGQKFVTYAFLISALLKFVNGHPFSAQVEARRELLRNANLGTTLIRQDFCKAITGMF